MPMLVLGLKQLSGGLVFKFYGNMLIWFMFWWRALLKSV